MNRSSPWQTPKREISDPFVGDDTTVAEDPEYLITRGRGYSLHSGFRRGRNKSSTDLSTHSRHLQVQRTPTTYTRDQRGNDSAATLWNRKRLSGGDRNTGIFDQPATPSIESAYPGSTEPPRPAKAGFEWVWFPAGYWAERPAIEIVRPVPRKAAEVLERPILPTRSASDRSVSPGWVSHKVRSRSKTSRRSPSSHSELDESETGSTSSRRKLVRGITFRPSSHSQLVAAGGQAEGLLGWTRRGIKSGLKVRRKEVRNPKSSKPTGLTYDSLFRTRPPMGRRFHHILHNCWKGRPKS